MIDVLDDTLLWLLKGQSEPGRLLREAAISFEMPDDTWRGGITKLTLNCYLYDIRENRSLRTNEDLVLRTADGRTLRQAAPRPVDCTYCITAWTPRSDTAAISSGDAIRYEHRLLSEALGVLLRNPQIEASTLQDPEGGARRLPPRPVRASSAEEQRGMSEFWTALGQQPKPSVNFTLTLAVPLHEAAPAASSPERVHIQGTALVEPLHSLRSEEPS